MRLHNRLIKKINDEIEAYKNDISSHTYIEIKEEKGIINLHLNKTEIYKPYSGNSLLEEEIYEFIEESMKVIKPNLSVGIKLIFPDSFSSEEKEKIERMIRMHYALKFKESYQRARRNKIMAWLLLLFGSLLFILYGLLEWYNVNFLFRGTIEIFSWVFIWASCESFFFTDWENKKEALLYLRLYKSEIIRE